MKTILWKTFALHAVWNFLFKNDQHFIVSEKGYMILKNMNND